MAEPLRISSGELSTDEIIEQLQADRRVVVETEVLGASHEITLRYDGSTYYCDSPTKLHTHDDEAGMRQCILEQGYSADEE
jgi:hypothetical protein